MTVANGERSEAVWATELSRRVAELDSGAVRTVSWAEVRHRLAAADVLGVTQPKVSALRHYKLAGFSVERLMNLLTALDQDVEIVIRQKPRSRKSARVSVVAV